MSCFDFRGLALDAALRLAFAAIHVPGEAQKVDRVIHAFATAYYRQEPGPFVDATAAYVAAFSTMLLNTDQHNPAVRAKMGLEAFLKNNKGINGGADLPPAYLEALYWAVVNEEIRAHELAPPSAAPIGPGAPTMALPSSPAAQRDGATAAAQHALPPMRSRWRFLRQRRAAAAAAAPPFTRRASDETRASDTEDEANGPRNGRGGVEGSAAEEEHASCLEVQRDLISHISPVVIELCAGLLSGPDGAGRYHGQPTVASPPATSPADWTLAMRTLVRCLALGARLGAVTGAPVQPGLDLRPSTKPATVTVNNVGLDLRPSSPGGTGAVMGAPSAVDRALLVLCEASRLPSMLLHDERLARPLLLAHSARPVLMAASAIALARAMPSHLGREAWYGLLKSYIVLLHLGLAPFPTDPDFPTDPSGAAAPALAAHGAAGAAGTGGAAGASSGEMTISSRIPAIPSSGEMTISSRIPAIPSSGEMTISSRIPAIPSSGEMTISSRIPAIPAAAADTEAAAAAAAQLTIERLLGAPLPAAGPNPTAPNPTAPPWEMARGWQQLLHGTVGAGLLTRAVLGAADTSNALLPALMRIVDETMPLALASASLPPHASALSAYAAAQTAATSLSLLAQALDLLGGAAPQWARPAAVQRMQWVVAQPQCPIPVRQAASRGLQRMQGATAPPPPVTRAIRSTSTQ